MFRLGNHVQRNTSVWVIHLAEKLSGVNILLTAVQCVNCNKSNYMLTAVLFFREGKRSNNLVIHEVANIYLLQVFIAPQLEEFNVEEH